MTVTEKGRGGGGGQRMVRDEPAVRGRLAYLSTDIMMNASCREVNVCVRQTGDAPPWVAASLPPRPQHFCARCDPNL